jgi:arylsulfatase A-like enzyme
MMNRHRCAIVIVALAAICAVSGYLPAAETTASPNIVYIMLDEWGYYEWSGMGHPILDTPNIDRFADEGMRFTQFLAGGNVCAPTRCSLLTGQHTGHCPRRNNGPRVPLHPDDVTIAEVLKDAGYATGGFGKWGAGDRGTTGVPEKQGFDIFFGYYDQTHAHTYYPNYLVRNSEKVPLEGNTGSYLSGETFSHELIYQESVKFIEGNAKAKKPFFAYLAWTPPHGLWHMPPDEPAWLKYKDIKWDGKNQRGEHDQQMYAAMLEMCDRQIGEILALLKQLDIDRNTIVFLCGDNGGQPYFQNEQHPDGVFRPNVDPKTGKRFRGRKGNFYEGGLRIPFLVRWPGHVKPGTVSDHLGYFPDVMPTLAELTGLERPESTDGISIVPTLLGEGEQQQHRCLYWEDARGVAVRIGHWKAIRSIKKGKPGPWELYDLASDIEELNNVATDHPEMVALADTAAGIAHRPVRPGTVLDPAAGFQGHGEK